MVAQALGLGNNTLLVNITLMPSLRVGNYTIVRELEVDPEQIWISYGRGSIGRVEILEENLVSDAGVGVIPVKESGEGRITGMVTRGGETRYEETDRWNFTDQLNLFGFIFLLLIIIIEVAFLMMFLKSGRKKKDRKSTLERV